MSRVSSISSFMGVCVALVIACAFALCIPASAFAADTANAFISVEDRKDAVSQDAAESFKGIIEDGKPVSIDTAYKLALTSSGQSSHIGETLQNDYWLYSGCEFASLSIVLKCLNLEVAPDTLINKYVKYDGSFVTGFMGDPYYGGGVFAPGIVTVANKYLAEKGSDLRAHNITGTSFENMVNLAKSGHPVLVWSTIDCQEPQFTGLVEGGYKWYENEHCVVVFGIGVDKVYVSDPLEGRVDRDISQFKDVYNKTGCMAVSIW